MALDSCIENNYKSQVPQKSMTKHTTYVNSNDCGSLCLSKIRHTLGARDTFRVEEKGCSHHLLTLEYRMTGFTLTGTEISVYSILYSSSEIIDLIVSCVRATLVINRGLFQNSPACLRRIAVPLQIRSRKSNFINRLDHFFEVGGKRSISPAFSLTYGWTSFPLISSRAFSL